MSREPNRLERSLGSARWRLWLMQALRLFGWLATPWFGVLVLIALVRFASGLAPFTPDLMAILFLGTGLVAVLAIAQTMPSLMAAARALDRNQDLADRFTTAWSLKTGKVSSALGDLALREVETFIDRHHPKLRVEWPRSLLVPLLATGVIAAFTLLHWTQLYQSSVDRAAASSMLQDASTVVDPVPEELRSELVERLQTTAREIATNRALDANEEALRALARAADALRSELAAAAASTTAAADDSSNSANHPASSNSESTSQSPDSSGTLASERDQELLAEAAERAKERIENPPPASGRSPFTPEQLAQMDRALDGLENLKARARGEKSSNPRDESRPQDPSNQAFAMSGEDGGSGMPPESGDQQSERPGGPGGGEDPNADGLPGNERPIADATGPEEIAPMDDLAGISVTASLISSGGAGSATAAYRDVYNLVEPEAARAVRNENIPPGIRQTVRTYFESIRPAPSRAE